MSTNGWQKVAELTKAVIVRERTEAPDGASVRFDRSETYWRICAPAIVAGMMIPLKFW